MINYQRKRNKLQNVGGILSPIHTSSDIHRSDGLWDATRNVAVEGSIFSISSTFTCRLLAHPSALSTPLLLMNGYEMMNVTGPVSVQLLAHEQLRYRDAHDLHMILCVYDCSLGLAGFTECF